MVSALALSFVLGLQYMVAPGTDEMQYADFRSLVCKSQEHRGQTVRFLTEAEKKGFLFEKQPITSKYILYFKVVVV